MLLSNTRVLAVLLAFLGLVAAWTKEDHEIFDLVSALEAAEGKGTTFYSLLGIESGATQPEITKAYRKKSMEMHPDKNLGVKDIHDRFARLGVITGILRSPEGRERYNFFYKNGVPKWRGTGYYYSRFRPTLFHTILFLVFLTSMAHLLVMRMNYTRDQKRVEYFERNARAAAGLGKEKKAGKENGVSNGEKEKVRRRKVRVPMVEGNEGAGTLELIVEGDQVYLPHEDGTQTPLSTLATPASLTRVWPILLARTISRRVIAILPPNILIKLPPGLAPPTETDDDELDSDPDQEQLGVDGTPTPAPRRGRASELKRQERLNGKKGGSGASTPKDSPATTEVESEGEEEVDAEGKVKRKALGKAGGARRRKMGMKK